MPNSTSFLSYLGYCVVKIESVSFTIVRVTSMPTSASPKARQGFNYASLDAVTSQFVQQQTGEIRVLAQRTIQDIYDIGQKLLWVKERIGHGRFLDWLAAEVGWSERNAQRFMNVAEGINKRLQGKSANLSDLNLDLSALYYATAPSTPEPAWEEIFGRAIAGERINYTKTQQVKQKHTTSPSKPKPEQQQQPQPASLPQQTSTLASQFQSSRPKQEIVAILPRAQAPSVPQTNGVMVAQTTPISQTVQPPVAQPNVPGIWWQLAGKHLLYCGDPNSREFSERINQKVSLLLAFPPTPDWQPVIRAKTRIITDEYLPQGKDLRLFEDGVETLLLLYSNLKDMVVSCYIPSPEILSIINRLGSRGMLADPDLKRCNAIISDWKKAGVKVERLN